MEVRKRRVKKSLIVVGIWLLVLSLLAQPVIAVTMTVQIEGPNSRIWEGTVNTKPVTITPAEPANSEDVTYGANIAASALEAAAKEGGFSTRYTWSGT
ncbi:MAG TPA: hypothetical protein ENH57_02565, partial [Actinobacteria bacterium]|nr:hypothetical protein [Actinomycetota bacterium]